MIPLDQVCGGDPSAPFFSAARGVPRGDCYAWAEGMDVVSIVSNYAIWLAYLFIPAVFLSSVAGGVEPVREALTSAEKRRVIRALSAFVVVCGFGHLETPVSFMSAHYHAWALYDALTAVVSWWSGLTFFSIRLKILGALT